MNMQKPIAYMGTDNFGNPNKFRLNPFNECIPLYNEFFEVDVTVEDSYGSPCKEFWEWIPKAYNYSEVKNCTKYNMEVAFHAGRQHENQVVLGCVKQALTILEEIRPGNMTPMAEESWSKAVEILHQLVK